MRLSQAVSPAEPITVKFVGAELHIMYRPMTYTPAQIDQMQAEAAEKGAGSKGTDSLINSMINMIESWDLTDEDDAPILLERGPMRQVPTNVYMAIMSAINKEQQAGEA